MDRARKLLDEVQDLLTQINFQLSPILLTFAQNTLAEIEWFDENRQKARTLLVDSQTRLRLVGEKLESSICIESLGLLSMEEGNLEQAQLYFEESLSIAEESEFRGLMAKRLALLSTLFYIQGDIAKSKQYFKRSYSQILLTKGRALLTKAEILLSLFISPCFQMPKNSVLLLGAIDSFEREIQRPINPLFKRYCIRAEASARKLHGNVAFQSVFDEGQKMSVDDALDFALKTMQEINE